jgi:hypothetical protein
MNAWLKRSLRLGQRAGEFDLHLSLQRIGRAYEARAQVHDQAGDFDCRSRKRDWRDAVRLLAADVSNRLHDQHVQRVI